MSQRKSNAPAASGRSGTRRSLVPELTGHLESTNPRPGKKAPRADPRPSTQPAPYVAMMADPLNADPVGRPDSYTWATNTQRFHDVHQVTTNAAGEACIIVTGCAVLGSYLAPTITASAVTAGGTSTPSAYNTSMTTDNSYYRTLAYVVSWTPTLSAQTASGRAFLGTYAVTGTSDLPYQLLADYYDDEGHTFSATTDAVTVVRPIQEGAFKTMTTTNFDLLPIVVFVVTGMPLSAQVVGQLTVTRIVETVPRATTLARSMAKHVPCDVMACCAAANVMGPAASRASGEDPYKKVATIGKKLAQLAMRSAAGYASGGTYGALMALMNQ